MAVTVTNNNTVIADADSGPTGVTTPVAGAWSTSGSGLGLDTAEFREASGAICATLITSGSTNYIIFTRSSGSWDLQNTHLYIWFNYTATKYVADESANGLQIRVGDGSNVGLWTVGGGDTYGGGWRCFVVNTARSFTSGTCTLSSVTSVGINITIAGGTPRNATNAWVDIIRYGNGGITVTGGTSGDPGKWSEIFNDDKSSVDNKAHGIVRREGGAYILQGPVYFGSTGSANTYFKDTSQVVTFDNLYVSTSLYQIVVQGGTGTTEVFFGNKSGTAGISGCFFKSANSALPFAFTATSSSITSLGLYGCSFVNAGIISLPTYTTAREMLNCNIETSLEMLASTCIVKYCNFISSSGNAVKVPATNYLTDCNFISCAQGVNIFETSDYSFTNLIFTGCTYDVNNTSGGARNVSNNGTTNAGTYTGSAVTFIDATTITIRVKDESGLPIDEALVYLDEDDLTSYIMNTQTNSSGVATGGHLAGGSIRVIQEITAWSDTSITFNVARGDIPTGTAYVVVRRADGTTSAPFAVTITS